MTYKFAVLLENTEKQVRDKSEITLSTVGGSLYLETEGKRFVICKQTANIMSAAFKEIAKDLR